MTVEPLLFGDDALRYAREELAIAADHFRGPLAARLAGLDLQPPLFSFLTPVAAEAAHDWRSGGLDDGDSDRRLAAALSCWMGRPDPGRQRLVVLEDPIARRTDPSVDSRALHHGDQVYFASCSADDHTDVAHLFGQPAGYPGIGVVSRPLVGSVPSRELGDDALAALTSSAVAVLVRAWDDEGFLVAPVECRLSPDDLRC